MSGTLCVVSPDGSPSPPTAASRSTRRPSLAWSATPPRGRGRALRRAARAARRAQRSHSNGRGPRTFPSTSRWSTTSAALCALITPPSCSRRSNSRTHPSSSSGPVRAGVRLPAPCALGQRPPRPGASGPLDRLAPRSVSPGVPVALRRMIRRADGLQCNGPDTLRHVRPPLDAVRCATSTPASPPTDVGIARHVAPTTTPRRLRLGLLRAMDRAEGCPGRGRSHRAPPRRRRDPCT